MPLFSTAVSLSIQEASDPVGNTTPLGEGLGLLCRVKIPFQLKVDYPLVFFVAPSSVFVSESSRSLWHWNQGSGREDD